MMASAWINPFLCAYFTTVVKYPVQMEEAEIKVSLTCLRSIRDDFVRELSGRRLPGIPNIAFAGVVLRVRRSAISVDLSDTG